jgi:hypothetical protein
MKRGIYLGLSLVCLVFIIGFVSSYTYGTINYVEFNGEFANGTTLYSDLEHVNNFSVYGKDTYPDKSDIGRAYVCENKTRVIKERVCTQVEAGFEERLRTKCTNKWNNDLHRYETICEDYIYLRPIGRRTVCEYVYHDEIYEKCKWVRDASQQVICQNPNGTASNVLALENFKMSLDGGANWQYVPYYENKLIVTGESMLVFKVDIPSECNPEYFVDRGILVKLLSPVIEY